MFQPKKYDKYCYEEYRSFQNFAESFVHKLDMNHQLTNVMIYVKIFKIKYFVNESYNIYK